MKKLKSLSGVQLFETPWTVARQDPLSMEFSRQEHWSGGFPGGPVVQNPPSNAGNMGWIPGQETKIRMLHVLELEKFHMP